MEKERIIDILEKESEFEKVSATYLFYGDKRVDLIYYAKEFCKLILLKNKQSIEDEEYIMRQINDESHPDIEIINKDNSGIKIDKVREIIYYKWRGRLEKRVSKCIFESNRRATKRYLFYFVN